MAGFALQQRAGGGQTGERRRGMYLEVTLLLLLLLFLLLLLLLLLRLLRLLLPRRAPLPATGLVAVARAQQPLCHPELKVRTPAHTKHPGWYPECETRRTHRQLGPPRLLLEGLHVPAVTSDDALDLAAVPAQSRRLRCRRLCTLVAAPPRRRWAKPAAIFDRGAGAPSLWGVATTLRKTHRVRDVQLVLLELPAHELSAPPRKLARLEPCSREPTRVYFLFGERCL